MKGMVRMGSSNALQALGMGGSATARRTSDSSDTLESEEMAIHRVPSRSGRISSMVGRELWKSRKDTECGQPERSLTRWRAWPGEAGFHKE